MAKLKHYLDRPAEMRRVAHNGFLHALKYHRSVTRLDWILRSALEAKAVDAAAAGPGGGGGGSTGLGAYTATGEKLRGMRGSEGSLAIAKVGAKAGGCCWPPSHLNTPHNRTPARPACTPPSPLGVGVLRGARLTVHLLRAQSHADRIAQERDGGASEPSSPALDDAADFER